MKKFTFALLVAFAGVASAQESYTISVNANQATRVEKARLHKNRQTCERWQLPASCTQAQVCVTASVAGGASCTVTAARTAGVEIYTAGLAGRQDFLTFSILVPAFQDFINQATAVDYQDACVLWAGFNQTQKNSVCSSIGLPAGCEICR
jgi:hypothetical protein